MSIRLRLMLLFTTITAVILGAFSINIYYSTVYIRKNAFLDRLWERSDIVVQLLRDNPNPDLSCIHPSARNTYWTILPEEEIVVFDNNGHSMFINEFTALNINYYRIIELLKKTETSEYMLGQRKFVGVRERINGKTYYVIVSAWDKNGHRLLNNLRITIVSSFIASIMVIILAGWLFSRKIFQPIEKIIETAGRISETDLHLRVSIPRGKNELVRLVNTINESFDRLQKSFEVQKTFVANASHELRTPLTALQGDLELALYKERSAEEYRQYLYAAYEDSRQLSRLVNNLLLFAQTSNNPNKLDFQPVRVDELLLDVIQKTLISYPGRNIDFRFKDKTSDERRYAVYGIENLLSIAFANILENALKFSKGTPVLIEISTENNLAINIIDHGIGISLADVESIFVPFYRSKRSSDVTGFGLGLPLARQIIELHNGTISVESKISEGTKVMIIFPSSL